MSFIQTACFKILKMEELNLKCPDLNCPLTFKKRFNLNRHYERFHLHSNIVEKCFLCGQIFVDCAKLQEHYISNHTFNKKFKPVESAFRKSIITYRYNFKDNEYNFPDSQHKVRKNIFNTILCEAAKKTVCKVSLVYIALMQMTDNEGDKVSSAAIPFRAPSFIANALVRRNISKNITRSFQHQGRSLEEFMNSGSNWQFDRGLVFHIEIAELKPIVGGAVITEEEKQVNISEINNRKFLYNPYNKDQKCFLYCVAKFLYKTDPKSKKSEETQLKKHLKNFNTKNISFPISIQGISKFLNQNTHLDLKINILLRTSNTFGKEKIFPYEYGLGKGKKIMNILLVQKQIKLTSVNHYLLITNVDKYLRAIYINQKKVKSYQKTNFCLNCLNSFSSAYHLQEHSRICCLNKPRLEMIPEEKKRLIKFRNFEKQHKLEYVAFLDFECALPKEENYCFVCSSLKCKCDASFTDILSNQEPIGYSFVVIGPKGNAIHENSYIGANAGEVFVEHLLEQEKSWVKPLLSISEELNMSEEDNKIFYSSKFCYMCDTEFSEKVIKCRDHSHITSKFIGAACQQCNLRRKRPQKLKIFIHNGSRYDFHFIVKALGKYGEAIESISVLPYNGENFRTLSFNSFEFNDSLAFLQAPLAQLCSDLKQTNHTYNILKSTFVVRTNGQFDKEKFDMVLEKSFFPYEYCTSLELMKKTTKLPKRRHFYSSLSEETISKKDYNFAKKVWKKFNCQNLVDYAKIYCKIDTILLAEVFQKFREDMHKFSGLDPAHYISLPSYSYDSMLKMTNCEIHLPSDINMVQFIESGKRGGVAFIGSRKLTPCSTTNEKSEIVYIDANVN
jgi:hypothetical protein